MTDEQFKTLTHLMDKQLRVLCVLGEILIQSPEHGDADKTHVKDTLRAIYEAKEPSNAST